MEVKSRPIPVTILDFMAILLPGLVWVFLLFVTFQLAASGKSSFINSPIIALKELASPKPSEFSWTPAVILVVFVAIIIGYILKPIATQLSESLTSIFLIRKILFKKIRLKDLRFPFKHYYGNTDYYEKIYNFIENELECSPDELPGKQPFSAAKRFIRVVCPTLWEECERMEAEVRMISTIFLAAVYNFLLSAIVLISTFFTDFFSALPSRNIWVWFVVSIFLMIFLAKSFDKLRFREVGYLYLNALIARKFGTVISANTKKSDSDEQ